MITLSTEDNQAVSLAVSRMRRYFNHLNWVPREFQIASLRFKVMCDPDDPTIVALLKHLILYPDAKDKYIVTNHAQSTEGWGDILGLSSKYSRNASGFQSMWPNQHNERAIYQIGWCYNNSYPYFVSRDDLLTCLETVKNYHPDKFEKPVVCSTCSNPKEANKLCMICGWLPKAVRDKEKKEQPVGGISTGAASVTVSTSTASTNYIYNPIESSVWNPSRIDQLTEEQLRETREAHNAIMEESMTGRRITVNDGFQASIDRAMRDIERNAALRQLPDVQGEFEG